MNIIIKNGTYKIRGKDVNLVGLVFPLVEEFKVGAKGGYVTVDGRAVNGFPAVSYKNSRATATVLALVCRPPF